MKGIGLLEKYHHISWITGRIALFLIVFLMSPTIATAIEVKEVVSTSPSWETFTNQDGTGLYHEILREVFALYSIPVRHEYSKSSRSEELVLQNTADMMTCDDKAHPPLVLARYPMYENVYYVFFKRDRIGPWQGTESLRDKEILSQPTYYNASNFPVPVKVKDVQTGTQALAMILLDRSDFYVDDLALMNESMKQNTTPFDMKEYAIEEVGRRSYYPLFNTTKRGAAIKNMYEEGMKRLHESGKLKGIYDKWGHQYPDFDSH